MGPITTRGFLLSNSRVKKSEFYGEIRKEDRDIPKTAWIYLV